MQRGRISLLAMLLIASSSVSSADPAPFLAVDRSWGHPSYDARENTAQNDEEGWTYNKGTATLILIRQRCSACAPISHKATEFRIEPEDVGVIIDHFGKPALLSFAKSHSHAQVMSFRIVSPPWGYMLQLVIDDSASSPEGFSLQQEMLRMTYAFRPE
jgi:hypothetical protein